MGITVLSNMWRLLHQKFDQTNTKKTHGVLHQQFMRLLKSLIVNTLKRSKFGRIVIVWFVAIGGHLLGLFGLTNADIVRH